MIPAVLAALALAAPAPAVAEVPEISVQPARALTSGFDWSQSDYALRCNGASVRLSVRGAAGWRASVQGGPARRGSFSRRVAARPGVRTSITFAKGQARRRFHLRCLPEAFPAYRYRRLRPGGPAFLFVQMKRQYAAILDRNGVPVWWYKAGGLPHNFSLLRRGVVTFAPGFGDMQFAPYELRTLTGRLLGVVGPPDGEIDVHEILALANGNYMVARRVPREVDTTPFGPADATVVDIELEEVTPGGEVVWRWSSAEHIDPAETGRWWLAPNLAAPPYDLYHWNATEVSGNTLLLTFRHLDAAYAIDRTTGEILWKLGGTPTEDSLEILGDPHGDYPLGGPHDTRVLPDGTVSVYDNRIDLPGLPRMVRYRINPEARIARMVQSISDPAVKRSYCCGSSRLLGSTGNWVIGWGGVPITAGYDREGRRLFTLRTTAFGYRGNFATAGQLSIAGVRRGMDAIARGPNAG